MSLNLHPLFLSLETTPGLEDYAAEMVLRSLQSGMSRVSIYVDAAILSGYVLLKFPAEGLTEDSSPKPLEEALELCRSGKIACIFAVYVCVEDVTLDHELRDDLRQDWRAYDLRKNEESRRVEKRRPWGARQGPDDRPKGRGHHRRGDGSEPTQAELEFLRTAQCMVENGHARLSSALRVSNPLISRYSFRATLKNPQHLVPFPILSTAQIEMSLGESVSTWLDSREVENIQNWKALCENASKHVGSLKNKLGRLWKVDLKNSEVEVVLHLLSVPPSPHVRSINPVDQAPPYSGHSPRPEFPATIRLILGIRLSGITPPQGRPGRTALSPVTAQLLAVLVSGPGGRDRLTCAKLINLIVPVSNPDGHPAESHIAVPPSPSSGGPALGRNTSVHRTGSSGGNNTTTVEPPPAFGEKQSPEVVPKAFFFYGFIMPLFWLLGALVLTVKLRAIPPEACGKTAEEQEDMLKLLRQAEENCVDLSSGRKWLVLNQRYSGYREVAFIAVLLRNPPLKGTHIYILFEKTS
ncbi:hypothetical protein FS837_010649 [Tulasnella sp. UAMH 9824]|nr:hypothetical protein FS837_010649 [Tulasnella sp. UAMH 9824]